MTVCLIIYNDPYQKSICALYKFSYIRDVIRWSDGMLNYSDADVNKKRVYVTYKSFFKIVRLKNTH